MRQLINKVNILSKTLQAGQLQRRAVAFKILSQGDSGFSGPLHFPLSFAFEASSGVLCTSLHDLWGLEHLGLRGMSAILSDWEIFREAKLPLYDEGTPWPWNSRRQIACLQSHRLFRRAPILCWRCPEQRAWNEKGLSQTSGITSGTGKPFEVHLRSLWREPAPPLATLVAQGPAGARG